MALKGGNIMNIKNRLIEDFYGSTKETMDTFIQYLPVILPINDDDAKTLSIALDMVKQLKEMLDNAESIKDLEDVIDIDALREDWNFTQNRLMNVYSTDVYDGIQSIVDDYTLELNAMEEENT